MRLRLDPHPKPLRETRADGSPWLVRYGVLPEDPRSLDPQFMYDQMSRRVLEPIYDTLLEYHPMKTDPYEVVPGMLAAMPIKEVSADGKISYLCELKRGILYHDDRCFPGGKGREVVARRRAVCLEAAVRSEGGVALLARISRR